ncbi:hypothetical protein [Vibrio sp. HN007]|uniref:hypothetical protein n=1 Tax=Vibrio iocasae TaxID=3098914 RepID=UPI0035D4C00D
MSKSKRIWFLSVAILVLIVVLIWSQSSQYKGDTVTSVSVNQISEKVYAIETELTDGSRAEAVKVEESCCYEHEEFSRESLLINGVAASSGQSIEFAGVCLTQKSELAILVSQWGGSATLEASLIANRYNRLDGTFDEVIVDLYGGGAYLDEEESIDVNGANFIQCGPSQKTYSTDGSDFIPCRCDLDRIEEIAVLEQSVTEQLKVTEKITIDNFEESFFDGEIHNQSTTVVGDEQLQKTLTDLQSIGGLPYEIRQFTNSFIDAMTIVYNKPMYDSFSVLLMREKSSKDWHLVYGSLPSSKGFHPPELFQINEDNSISAHMCLEGCDWWGNRFGLVNISLNTEIGEARFKLIEEIEW